MSEEISFEDFVNVDIRIGTIIEVHDFPKAKKPAYQLTIDFGALGHKKSSAQITDLYRKEDLLHKQVLIVIQSRSLLLYRERKKMFIRSSHQLFTSMVRYVF